MKGNILAGGSGTRHYPLTKSISKQLLPVYDKPMIFYPLSVLIRAQIQDILIIVKPEEEGNFRKIIGDGSKWNVNIDFLTQDKPSGIAEALIIADDWLNESKSMLILGDNLFFGQGLKDILLKTFKKESGATIFGYQVADPERYGVVDFDDNGNVLSLEEKPILPKSNYAVTGLYFYPNDVINKVDDVTPSDRGELEITSLNEMYLLEQRLEVEIMGRGYAWLDTGTHENLLEASTFIENYREETGAEGCLY